jgi:hypothetical protein
MRPLQIVGLFCLMAAGFSFHSMYKGISSVNLRAGNTKRFMFFGKNKEEKSLANSIFEFSVDSNAGKPLNLSSLKGKKAYLIVNVASK